MVTASHNPPEDNGYKVYLGDGAQIVPPATRRSRRPSRAGPLPSAGRPRRRARWSPTRRRVLEAYLDAIARAVACTRPAAPLRIVYTPLHGVADALALRAFAGRLTGAARGPGAGEPDPDFPTGPSPTRRSRARWTSLRQARRPARTSCSRTTRTRTASRWPSPTRADAVGACSPATRWACCSGLPARPRRRATGRDARWSLRHRLVPLLSAHRRGGRRRYVETLTGFKWIVRAIESSGPGEPLRLRLRGGARLRVGDVVRDKDGISAALAVLALAASARSAGQSLLDPLGRA